MTDLARGSNGERLPEPGLESAIFAGRRGDLQLADVARLFAGWPVLVASDGDRADFPAGLLPVVVSTVDGGPLVAVFTSPDQVGEFAEGRYVVNLAGGVIAAGARNGAGIVVNPGGWPSMEFTPEAMPLIADFPREVLPGGAAGRDLSPFEIAVAGWAARTATVEPVLDALRDTELIFPSNRPESDPARVVFPREDAFYVAATSHEDLLRADQVGPVLSTRTARIADAGALIPPGWGVVVNPGTALGMRLDPDVVDALR